MLNRGIISALHIQQIFNQLLLLGVERNDANRESGFGEIRAPEPRYDVAHHRLAFLGVRAGAPFFVDATNRMKTDGPVIGHRRWECDELTFVIPPIGECNQALVPATVMP